MEIQKSSPPPNSDTSHHRLWPEEGVPAKREARRFRDSGLWADAYDRYTVAISETPPDHCSLGLLYLERAQVGITLGRNDDGLSDLIHARERIEILEGELQYDLAASYNSILKNLPRENRPLPFRLGTTAEGTFVVLPEPAAEEAAVVSPRPERERVPAVLGRLVLDVET